MYTQIHLHNLNFFSHFFLFFFFSLQSIFLRSLQHVGRCITGFIWYTTFVQQYISNAFCYAMVPGEGKFYYKILLNQRFPTNDTDIFTYFCAFTFFTSAFSLFLPAIPNYTFATSFAIKFVIACKEITELGA